MCAMTATPKPEAKPTTEPAEEKPATEPAEEKPATEPAEEKPATEPAEEKPAVDSTDLGVISTASLVAAHVAIGAELLARQKPTDESEAWL